MRCGIRKTVWSALLLVVLSHIYGFYLRGECEQWQIIIVQMVRNECSQFGTSSKYSWLSDKVFSSLLCTIRIQTSAFKPVGQKVDWDGFAIYSRLSIAYIIVIFSGSFYRCLTIITNE